MGLEFWAIVVLIILIILLFIIYTTITNRKHNRRIHVYGIGIFKSGTESLADIFKDYKSKHEYEKNKLFKLIIEKNERNIVDYIIEKDKELLEIDSSGLNIFIVHYLVHVFPECKFILTVRNIIDHYDSIINYLNCFPVSIEIAVSIMGKPNINIPKEELIVTKYYPQYWSLKTVIDTICTLYYQIFTLIPQNRLLVINLSNDKDLIHNIASFLNIPESSLQLCHKNKAKQYIKASSLLDIEYVKKISTNIYARQRHTT